MTKKLRFQAGVLVFIIILLVAMDVLVRKPFFGTARERLYELLHKSAKVEVKGDSMSIANKEFLKKYYDNFGYKKNFTDSSYENNKYRSMLIAMLNHADSLGLDRKDYNEAYIKRYDSLSRLPTFDRSQYESENEMIFTDAALSFLYNVAYGKEINVGFNGVKYNIDSTRIVNTFNALLVHRDWRKTLDSIEPKTSQYIKLKTELNRMQSNLRLFPALDTIHVTADGSRANKYGLRLVLSAYGAWPEWPDSIPYPFSEETEVSVARNLKIAIGRFQKMMSYDTTGKLDDKTVAALNFPLNKRVGQIKESLNYWRWTGRLKESQFILVNIPAARLQIVKNDSSAADISMRVIVGKNASQTPSFTAYINKVITYPYWTVPLDIETKEMLPKIKKNPNYLDENNLQVFTPKGLEVDPATIDWNKYSVKYFPYVIRQSTGCDNSLGVLKFDLNSPYSIYLHDTNARGLFKNKDRFLSHGCVRLEKPMVLAEYVLKEGIDTSVLSELNKAMAEQKQSEFRLKNRFPVLILYMTSDVDEFGNLKFYKDVYGVEEVKKKVS